MKKLFKDKKISFFDLVWVFIITAIFGWAIELIWFYVKWGYFQYNQGMVFGPFQQIYGFGGVLLFIISSMTNDKNKWKTFVLGFIIFGLFEFLSGFFIEYFTGTFAWNYSRVGFSFVIAKYIYLPYCFIWGLFTVLYQSFIHDKLVNIFDKFKNKWTNILTVIVFIFILLNLLLTNIAISRFVARNNKKPPSNNVEKFIDRHFTDEYLKKYLPKVRIIK